MPIIFITLFVVFALEQFLLYRWSTSYFTQGIRIFTARIPANAPSRALLLPNSLERDVAPLTSTTLAFYPLTQHRIAFRESFAGSFTNPHQRYYPVMRGLIEVDARRDEIRVHGLCNWTVLVLPLVFLMLAIVGADRITAIVAALGFLVVFAIGYSIQRKAYFKVVEAVKAQL
ncbi:hypothetical protein [Stenotrophomonas oahuensis]|uniref:Uncharacterized protein n=1 Tax=Stenotrophomonas oahuensis TaxID=3003271 RepID=A0ABY9YTG8_9GAMM|nr:hypothetical protein [Stenotrophomonas sp. A5586]WNH54171.1 hypothetical protein PDM29_07825 [Stenotrophomonas sp. A5586]